MDCGEGGYLSRRSHSGICGRSTTGTRSRRGDVPARRRGGGELSHGAESASVGATCVRHGRTILDAVRAEEPARRRVVLGGRDFRSQYQRAVEYAGAFSAPARLADHGVVVASEVGRDMKRALLVLLLAGATALQAHGATYYVAVAGLGGEPDYQQRFTAAAKDLYRIFTAAGPAAHVYLLAGEQATGADTDRSDSISAMEAFRYATKKTAAFYDSQKRLATEHAVFNDTGRGEAVREAGNGQGLLMSSFTLLRLGTSQQAGNDPAKRALLEKKDQLEQKIDTLKYQKAAMDPHDYKKQLTEALVELAKVQEQLDK